ncbi:MAG: energy-coupling factor ABC transporter permease [Planctomycetaceae bacterium]
MHVSDGILSAPVSGVAALASVTAVAISLRQLRDQAADRIVPFTGMMAALIFAGQMVNFPLFGTLVSGHLMGGVLAAVILGPFAGCLALTLVLLVQCLLFADGGLTALGVNTLHMAVLGAMGGYAVYAVGRRILGGGPRAALAAAMAASWLSVMAAAALFCLEFRLSWPHADYDFSKIFTLMTTLHSAIGLGEAVITGVVVSFVLQHRPDLIAADASNTRRAISGRVLVAGSVVALAISAFLAPFASPYPDGLEAVAQRTEFDSLATDSTKAAFAEYTFPPLRPDWQSVPGWQVLSVSLAGVLGTLSVLCLAIVLGRTLRKTPSNEAAVE